MKSERKCAEEWKAGTKHLCFTYLYFICFQLVLTLAAKMFTRSPHKYLWIDRESFPMSNVYLHPACTRICCQTAVVGERMRTPKIFWHFKRDRRERLSREKEGMSNNENGHFPPPTFLSPAELHLHSGSLSHREIFFDARRYIKTYNIVSVCFGCVSRWAIHFA